jgi:hypothetical protein
VCLKVSDIAQMGQARARAMIIQKKTKTPVRFEITAPTREAVNAWIRQVGLTDGDWLFPSRITATAAGRHTLELSESSARGGLPIKGWVSFQSAKWASFQPALTQSSGYLLFLDSEGAQSEPVLHAFRHRLVTGKHETVVGDRL